VGVAAWPALAGTGEAEVPLLLGLIGWALLATALLMRWAALVAPALAFFGAGYVVSLGPAIDGRAPLYAGLLLLTAELVYWTLELRVPMAAERGTHQVRAVVVAAAVAAGLVLATAMIALTALPPLPGGTALEVVGILAAAGALTLVVLLARPREA
jgi:hypothetical protein